MKTKHFFQQCLSILGNKDQPEVGILPSPETQPSIETAASIESYVSDLKTFILSLDGNKPSTSNINTIFQALRSLAQTGYIKESVDLFSFIHTQYKQHSLTASIEERFMSPLFTGDTSQNDFKAYLQDIFNHPTKSIDYASFKTLLNLASNAGFSVGNTVTNPDGLSGTFAELACQNASILLNEDAVNDIKKKDNSFTMIYNFNLLSGMANKEQRAHLLYTIGTNLAPLFIENVHTSDSQGLIKDLARGPVSSCPHSVNGFLQSVSPQTARLLTEIAHDLYFSGRYDQKNIYPNTLFHLYDVKNNEIGDPRFFPHEKRRDIIDRQFQICEKYITDEPSGDLSLNMLVHMVQLEDMAPSLLNQRAWRAERDGQTIGAAIIAKDEDGKLKLRILEPAQKKDGFAHAYDSIADGVSGISEGRLGEKDEMFRRNCAQLPDFRQFLKILRADLAKGSTLNM